MPSGKQKESAAGRPVNRKRRPSTGGDRIKPNARDNNLFQVTPEIIAGSLIATTAADNVHEIMTEFRKSLA
jgi:hypothetical protein